VESHQTAASWLNAKCPGDRGLILDHHWRPCPDKFFNKKAGGHPTRRLLK
jgi:hypothetical protein